jgi:hypothetical protein
VEYEYINNETVDNLRSAGDVDLSADSLDQLQEPEIKVNGSKHKKLDFNCPGK